MMQESSTIITTTNNDTNNTMDINTTQQKEAAIGKSITLPTKKSRASTKEDVANRWATRRSQSTRIIPSVMTTTTTGDNNAGGTTNPPPNTKPTLTNNSKKVAAMNDGSTNPTLCHVVCKAWHSFQNPKTPSQEKITLQKTITTSSSSSSEQENNRKTRAQQLSERMANIQRAAAVQEELNTYSLRKEEERRKKLKFKKYNESSNDNNNSDEKEDNDDDSGGGEEEEEEKELVSVLPSGYDVPLALSTLSSTRTRVFLLLDLASIISSHRMFIRYTAGTGVYSRLHKHSASHMRRLIHSRRKGVFVQPEFTLGKNRDLELVQLLVRLGVRLRCNCVEDVRIARLAIQLEKKRGMNKEEEMLVDDAGRARKPDGYLRRLLYPLKKKGRACHSAEYKGEITVDGGEEVHRIMSAIRRFEKSNTKQASTEHVRFLLCLPMLPSHQTDKMYGIWSHLVSSVHEATVQEGGCSIVGVSVDLQPWITELAHVGGKEEEMKSNTTALEAICTQLRHVRILLLSLNLYPSKDKTENNAMRIDFTNLPYPLSKSRAESLTCALSTIVSPPVTMEELLASHPTETMTVGENITVLPNTIVYTADVSEHLVSHAGALCTRIIGLRREGYSTTKEEQGVGCVIPPLPNDDDQDMNTTAVTTGGKTHYYIDDGCYGSLVSNFSKSDDDEKSSCQSCNLTSSKKQMAFQPLPLYGPRVGVEETKVEETSHHRVPLTFPSTSQDTATTSPPNKPTTTTTVWGPTCDGLDKVCESMTLPNDLEANRDWLVFPDMGCGGGGGGGGGLGLGTSFNGFEPPDTVYCVLGYFTGGAGDGFGHADSAATTGTTS
mmetsp:Transcript_9220/g.13615  ORF Transcript_9220/g.13615 Transcript_9220/m.13615 type:complete len:833 (-) Transcript_9220:224-2722(-)